MRLWQIHIKNITTSYYIKILIIIMSTYCTRGTRATLLVSLKEASKLKAGRMITKRTKLGFHSFGLRIETGLSQKLTPYRRLSYQQYKDEMNEWRNEYSLKFDETSCFIGPYRGMKYCIVYFGFPLEKHVHKGPVQLVKNCWFWYCSTFCYYLTDNVQSWTN